VVAHPDIWEAKYSRRPSRGERYIGIPFVPEAVEAEGAEFHLSREPVFLSSDIATTGEVPLVTEFETVDEALFVQTGGDFRTDGVEDDLALIIKTDQGLVVVCGCAHRGVVNTVDRARAVSGVERVYAVVGGVHLAYSDEERIGRTLEKLRQLEVKHLALGHCTGFRAAVAAARLFPDGFTMLATGIRLDIKGTTS
jgi:7,8-dihydropterin-6-yl-methyl-4-(beta-D-ribofuranosyl)aminobenzene 5'-phosphate synthase